MRDVTLVMPYYENPTMLSQHLSFYNNMNPEMRDRLEVIITDDGSPKNPALKQVPDDVRFDLKLYRILVDIRWNQDAARNIGVWNADAPWVLMTDMDHVVPMETWDYVLHALDAGALSMRTAYTFTRKSLPDLELYKPHPNSWLMTKWAFVKLVKGYDERFAGVYGSDGDFRNRLAGVCDIKELNAPLVRVPREVVPDASTTNYDRKTAWDDQQKRAIRTQRATLKDQSPKVLSFPYERVL